MGQHISLTIVDGREVVDGKSDMKNVYDIRKEKQLQFIFSTEQSGYVPASGELQSIAVVVNLYYTEKVRAYSQYLNHLQEGITLYIISSREDCLSEAQRCITHGNTIYLRKENRGRDISAFLVVFAPYAEKYELVCFLHDKKERAPWLKGDIDKWNENMWGNLAASPDYVCHVLQLFKNRPDLGMLFPPEPLGEYKTAWFEASWRENFGNCLELAKRLQISADIREDRPPIALGSAFWARKGALRKLLGRKWEYEDFPDEPMPLDYTVSHAVERIFGYIAQDAGYDVATIMTEQYASWALLFLQDHFRMMFAELSGRMGVDNLYQLHVLSARKERILHYAKAHKEVFLYGAGKYGKALLKLLREEGLEPSGFAITKKAGGQGCIAGLQVYGISDPELRKPGTGVILTVFFPHQEEMLRELEKNGIGDYMVLFDG